MKKFVRTARAWGNGIGVNIPQEICKHLDIHDGDIVELSITKLDVKKKNNV